jgi:drug/metabolite transporter (DMT)-like permease
VALADRCRAFSGGVVGPVLLMFGLSGMPASGASLLLNAEGVFTALLAWFAFKENFDRRIALGTLAIVAGALVLSWPGDAQFGAFWPSVAVLGACLAWGIDNDLTRRVSHADATWVAMVKGLAAGSVNLVIALALGREPAVARPARGFGRAGLLRLWHQPDAVRTLRCAAWARRGPARTSQWRHSSAPCWLSACSGNP